MKVTLLVPTLNEAVGMRSVMPKVKKGMGGSDFDRRR